MRSKEELNKYLKEIATGKDKCLKHFEADRRNHIVKKARECLKNKELKMKLFKKFGL